MPASKLNPIAFVRRLGALLALIVGYAAALPAAAHDFWLQPQDYWLTPQAATPLTLQVGHGPLRQRSPISMRRITRFAAIAPDGTTIDLRKHLHPGGDVADGDIELRRGGTYMLVLQTDNEAQSHLPAIRFNDYLRAEGLTLALQQRERSRRMDAEGSENYSRQAKSIVQVGSPDAQSQAAVTQPLNLPLEIVPERSPYAEPQSATLPVRVIYEGHALGGALVKLTDLANDAEPFETQLTDAEGRAVFTMPKTGSWLLNVIWTKPLPSSRDTDFETVFSSLSFGFPASAD